MLMYFSQITEGAVEIPLSVFSSRMAQQLLDGEDVGATCQEMAGTGVAQNMGSDIRGDA